MNTKFAGLNISKIKSLKIIKAIVVLLIISIIPYLVLNPNKLLINPNKLGFIDYDKVKLPLKIRSWKDGDRFYPMGARGGKKLQDFFTDEKIPANQRSNIPIFFDKEKIIWVGNLRIDNRVIISGKTARVLHLELFEK